MIIFSHTSRRHQAHRPRHTPRHGVALIFVMVFVIAMAALAMSSIFMASNANLLAKSYDRERDLKYAAEAALAIGKSRVNADPLILNMKPGQLDTTILSNYSIIGADGAALPGIKVNVYVGPTGSTSGQFGRFSSIVAEARDPVTKNGFIRRLELTQESFAKFAYWSNSESNGPTTIFFNNLDELWGPVWSNDTISIGSGKAIFHDEVGTVAFISGVSNGTFFKGYKTGQKPIALPSTATLNNLSIIANSSGWSFPSQDGPNQNENSVRDRLEFVATDLSQPADGDSLDTGEGLFRVYTANSGREAELRGDWGGTYAERCGDWHRVNSGGTWSAQFYPVAIHNNAWVWTQVRAGIANQNPTWTSTSLDSAATAERTASSQAIMMHANARCYPAGDPHLVATDRLGVAGYTASDYQKGGSDTTFTATGKYGAWKLNPTAPGAPISTRRPWDYKYLYPTNRQYNSSAKGVIYFSGNVGLSGLLNGQVTVYAKGTIVLLDDIKYTWDPVLGNCNTGDMLGLIASNDIVIADNAINSPQDVGSGNWRALDDTKDYYIHGVMMALGTSFRVQNFSVGPTAVNNCDITVNGRGCIYLSGGLIQNSRGAVGQSNGRGFAKRYSYDHCAVANPPPYFPTTGRFEDNRYLELDPAGFNHTAYFASIVP